MTKHWPSDRIAMDAKSKQKPCLWVEDNYEGYWVGSCGVKWGYEDGSPRENRMIFCPLCGKRLKQQGGEK